MLYFHITENNLLKITYFEFRLRESINVLLLRYYVYIVLFKFMLTFKSIKKKLSPFSYFLL